MPRLRKKSAQGRQRPCNTRPKGVSVRHPREKPTQGRQRLPLWFVRGFLLLLLLPTCAPFFFPGRGAAEIVAGPGLLAGAAEADITPRVASYEDQNRNGRFDLGDPGRAFGLGDPVLAFEEGEVRIGNGRGPARFIYDPLYAHALYLEDTRSGRKVVLVSADLYMFMFSDVEAIRSLVEPSLGIDAILIACTHTHMGPDTLGVSGLDGLSTADILRVLGSGRAPSGINREWFLRTRQTLAAIIEKAARDKRPATIRVAQTRFRFGLRDEREPLIIDDDLLILAVDDLDRQPIATAVQWACHPEATLLLADPRNRDRDLIELTPRAEEAWGRTISAGFPGYLCRELRERRGGVPLYFNGALGGMITNLHEFVWDPEQHPAYPATVDPREVPAEIRIPNDFRFEPIQGREAARHALRALEREGSEVEDTSIRVWTRRVPVPLDNPFYRLAAALGLVGYEARSLVDDQGLPVAGSRPWLRGCFLPTVRFPRGRNLVTEVSYLEIGKLGIVAVPAELLPELSVGLPDDFADNPKRYFPHHAGSHRRAADYRPAFPALKKQMRTPYKMVVCLAGDDLGYVIPGADFKPPRDLWWLPPLSLWWFCNDSETHPHYEESATASSEIEARLLGPLTEILDSAADADLAP